MGKQNFWERTSINIVTNVARTLVMALVGLFLIPYYLDNLGPAVYGVLPLATTVSSYVLILSDSLSHSCGRYVTLAIREGDRKKIQESFNSALFGISRTCLLLVPVVLVISYFSPDAFNVPSGTAHDVRAMFALVLMSSLVVSFSSAFNSIFLAYNRLYLLYIARLVYTVAQVLTIFLLFTVSEPSLCDIGVAYLFSSLILLGSVYILSSRIRGSLRIRLSDRNRDLFKEMGRLSFWEVCTEVGNLLYIEVSLILVNLYLGPAEEAGFAIISTIISMVSTAVISVASSIDPIIYRLYAEKREQDIIRTVHIAQKCLGFMIAMPMAFLIVFAPEVLTAWVGSDYVYLSPLIYMSMMASLIHCCSMAAGCIPVLYLKNQYVVVSIAFFGLFNVVASIAVLQFSDWGVEGAMAVWTVAFGMQRVVFEVICTKVTHAGYSEYFMPIAQSFSVLALCILLLFGLSSVVDIGTGWLTIIPVFAVLFIVYTVLAFRFLISKEEFAIASNILPGVVKKVLLR